MDLSDWVIVFDLDDTLYSEYEYVLSGINFLEEYLSRIYNYEFKGELNEVYKNKRIDFLEYACKKLNLTENSKESLLWIYRLHFPKIKLAPYISDLIFSLRKLNANILILTDGRSITQRLKLKALGLNHFPAYISEDFLSEKPNKKRFIQIERDYPSKRYLYIADNPDKDFIAPIELKWKIIGANWIKNKIHDNKLIKMPNICLDDPRKVKNIIFKFITN